jgi:hypothetical protein
MWYIYVSIMDDVHAISIIKNILIAQIETKVVFSDWKLRGIAAFNMWLLQSYIISYYRYPELFSFCCWIEGYGVSVQEQEKGWRSCAVGFLHWNELFGESDSFLPLPCIWFTELYVSSVCMYMYYRDLLFHILSSHFFDFSLSVWLQSFCLLPIILIE